MTIAASAIQVSDEKERVQRSFLNVFRNHGYQIATPTGLLAEDVDTSVIFIGSSTNVFKKFLTLGTGIPEGGVALYQRKLRTQNYNYFYKDQIPEFNSCFEGGGALVLPDRSEKLFYDILEFLDALGISSSDIVCKSSSQMPLAYELEKESRRENLPITFAFDTEPSSYYKWNFGIPDMYGIGITMALKHYGKAQNGEIGTLVAILDSNKAWVATEWGFGTETLLSRKRGLEHPASYLQLAEMLPFTPTGSHIKFCDALTTSLAIIDAKNYEELPGAAKTVLRRYLKALAFYGRDLKLSLPIIEGYILYLCKKEFDKNRETGPTVIKALRRRWERVEREIS